MFKQPEILTGCIEDQRGGYIAVIMVDSKEIWRGDIQYDSQFDAYMFARTEFARRLQNSLTK